MILELLKVNVMMQIMRNMDLTCLIEKCLICCRSISINREEIKCAETGSQPGRICSTIEVITLSENMGGNLHTFELDNNELLRVASCLAFSTSDCGNFAYNS